MHALLQPWSRPFMQRALLELVFVGVVGAVLGCWIVLYELAYSAESLAHALFPGLVAAIAAAIVVGVQGLGNLLVLSALIGPAATARALARRVPTMMLAATGVALGCALAGLYVSYYADIPAGAPVTGTTVVTYLALRPLNAARARPGARRRRRRRGRSRLSPASLR